MTESKLSNLIAARTSARRVHQFESSAFTKRIEGEQLPMRVLMVSEHMAAAAAGQRWLDKPEHRDARAELLDTARNVFMLHEACHDGERHVFPSAEWMLENLSSDELAALLTLYNSVEARESPVPSKFTDEEFDAYVKRIAVLRDSGHPAQALLNVKREWLEEFAIYLAGKVPPEESDHG